MKILREYNQSDLIFIDIETVRTVDKLVPSTPLCDAWAYKARYQNEYVEKLKSSAPEAEIIMALQEFFEEKAALYATFGRIATIVVGRIEEQVGSPAVLKTKAYTNQDEKRLLTDFVSDLATVTGRNPQACFCTFNGTIFDLPYMTKRLLVHGINLPSLLDIAHLKPWEIRTLDLSKLWQGTSMYPDSLNAVAVALGLPSPKTGLTGSEVSTAWYAGKLKEIEDYCVGDVVTTANIYRKFSGKSSVVLQPSTAATR